MLSARVTHRFTASAVSTAWSLRGARRGLRARVLFPTYGPGTHVEAELRNGRRVIVGSAPIALARVKRFLLRSARSGYEVVPVAGGGEATSLQVASQSSAPRADRSLVVRLSDTRFAARIRVRRALAVKP